MKNSKLFISMFLSFLFSFLCVSAAYANLAQVKKYQEAFGGDKPRCLTCHVSKMPLKAEGKHEWNDYGKKVRAEKKTPDVETYKKVGKNDKAVF